MAYLMSDILAAARFPLNDEDPDPNLQRYKDAELLRYANDVLNRWKARRPDMFFGQFSSLPNELLSSASFPVEDQFFPAAVDYVIARAHGKDAEAAYREVVSQYMTLSETVTG